MEYNGPGKPSLHSVTANIWKGGGGRRQRDGGGHKNAGKIPKTLVTDGLQSYRKALELLGLPIDHIGNAGLAKDENNNIVERLHGTIKEWVREKRGAREKFNEMVRGYRTYYNHMRPNIKLNEESPAKSEKKWINVITTAKKQKRNKQNICSLETPPLETLLEVRA